MPVKLAGYVCDNCRVFWDKVIKNMKINKTGNLTRCFCSKECEEKFNEEAE